MHRVSLKVSFPSLRINRNFFAIDFIFMNWDQQNKHTVTTVIRECFHQLKPTVEERKVTQTAQLYISANCDLILV